jgi:hypothetical protein
MKLPRNEPGPIAREGSRPRDPLLTKPSMFCNQGRKYTFGLHQVLTARGDARPPSPMVLVSTVPGLCSRIIGCQIGCSQPRAGFPIPRHIIDFVGHSLNCS